MIKTGRLPIAASNIQTIAQTGDTGVRAIINEKSADADLTVIGFKSEVLKRKGKEIFDGLDNLSNVLYVSAAAEKDIS